MTAGGHGDSEAEEPNDGAGPGSIAQQSSQHLIGTVVKESLKEGFEDNRILHRYF